jgi:lipopolysaccharide export system protein LptA
MNRNLILSCLCFASVLFAPPFGAAQLAPVNSKPREQNSPTTVTSRTLDADLVKHIAIFRGSVVVKDDAFQMVADEMTVFFNDKSNGVDKILARGRVKIDQQDKVATANEAEYFVADAKILLRGSPRVTQQGGNTLEGEVITFYRNVNRVQVDGRTTLVIDDPGKVGNFSPMPAAPATSPSKPSAPFAPAPSGNRETNEKLP